MTNERLAAIRNVAACVMQFTETTRDHNGRGRPPSYAARVDAIAGAARQLAEMIEPLLDEVERLQARAGAESAATNAPSAQKQSEVK